MGVVPLAKKGKVVVMGNNQNFNNLGDQIKGAVSEALGTGDFKKLNSIITDTVNTALSDAGMSGSKAWQQKETWKNNQNTTNNYSADYWAKQRQQRLEARRQQREQQLEKLRQNRAQASAARAQQPANNVRQTPAVTVKNVGMGLGVTGIVLGSIAMIPFVVFFILACTIGLGSPLVWGCLLAFAIGMIFAGADDVNLISRARRYVKICGEKMYASIEELAAVTGNSVRKTRKDIRKILKKGILPTARMDIKGTILMLNETVYQYYINAEKAKLELVKEEKKKKEAKTPSELVSEARAEQQSELQNMIAEGREYIKKLRDLNDEIEGEEISNKLYQLENILKEIFVRVEKEPDQMHRMKKVMEYYLPTTVKLVEAYRDYDQISTPNEEILSAKTEIEKTLDSINSAFVELLNSLFQASVFDVTTDAQVLQTMLVREGLTKELETVTINK